MQDPLIRFGLVLMAIQAFALMVVAAFALRSGGAPAPKPYGIDN